MPSISIRICPAFVLWIGMSLWIGTPAFAETEPFTNRLIQSADPYLRMHAHNPVDWYPWGPEAFAKAKAENKPIFLSIGYSTCYWCHVAEATIYSDPAIAALMNKWFVNVKVDREQQPDVDRLYILATEMLTDHGAWPNNLFLTPDLRPFYAGSYFPPKDDGDTPGFPKVLAVIHDLWDNHRADQLEPAAEAVMTNLRALAAKQAETATVPVTPAPWLVAAVATLLRGIDPQNGGLGSAGSGPKFPQAAALTLLLADAQDAAARKALTDTLDAMAYGGIRDQIAGGFHRYATEPTWSVPHFEKMLSDNAQLLSLYAGTYALTKEPLDRIIALDTAHYLLRDMAIPGGGFATAQDAETNGVEGASYLWTFAQIRDLLGAADTDRFLSAYRLTAMPDQPFAYDDASGSSLTPGVLRIRLPIDATLKRVGVGDVPALLAALAPERDKLLAARLLRRQPTRDDKIVTSLNGLAIQGLADAAIDLGAPDLLVVASDAATRIWSDAWNPNTRHLAHQIFEGKAEGDGYLDDYAAFGTGLLALGDATNAPAWHDKAVLLADALLTRFLKPNGALATGDGDDSLPITLGDSEDADKPSGTSSALALLGRLGAAPGGARFADAAAKIAAHLSSRIAARPTMWPSAVVALVDHPPATVSVVAVATPPVAVANARVPATADHVHVSAKVDGDKVVVTLIVDPGFHINAHKPSFDYLVPTDVTFAGLKPSTMDYPKAIRFKSAFAAGGLDVYEGEVSLIATFPTGALSGVLGVNGTVTAQACDAQTCLPPADLPINAANPAR